MTPEQLIEHLIKLSDAWNRESYRLNWSYDSGTAYKSYQDLMHSPETYKKLSDELNNVLVSFLSSNKYDNINLMLNPRLRYKLKLCEDMQQNVTLMNGPS